MACSFCEWMVVLSVYSIVYSDDHIHRICICCLTGKYGEIYDHHPSGVIKSIHSFFCFGFDYFIWGEQPICLYTAGFLEVLKWHRDVRSCNGKDLEQAVEISLIVIGQQRQGSPSPFPLLSPQIYEKPQSIPFSHNKCPFLANSNFFFSISMIRKWRRSH